MVSLIWVRTPPIYDPPPIDEPSGGYFGCPRAHLRGVAYTGLLNCLLAAVKGPRENRLLYIVLFTISYPRGRENMCKLVYMHTYANRHICIYTCIYVCAYCMQVYTYMIYDTKPPRCQEKHSKSLLLACRRRRRAVGWSGACAAS